MTLRKSLLEPLLSNLEQTDAWPNGLSHASVHFDKDVSLASSLQHTVRYSPAVGLLGRVPGLSGTTTRFDNCGNIEHLTILTTPVVHALCKRIWCVSIESLKSQVAAIYYARQRQHDLSNRDTGAEMKNSCESDRTSDDDEDASPHVANLTNDSNSRVH